MEQVDSETASPPFSSSVSSYDDDDGEEIDWDSDSNERIASRFSISVDAMLSSVLLLEYTVVVVDDDMCVRISSFRQTRLFVPLVFVIKIS